jgi:N-methylhydantoinase B
MARHGRRLGRTRAQEDLVISALDQAVIGQALLAVAREMGAKLYRSAYSTIVREAKDASTGILDMSGNAVAQSDELIPVLVGSLSLTFESCARFHPVDGMREGEFYITNHPYHGGQHLQDVFIFMPIFFEGELVGFSAAVAHHLDIGGGAPGLNVAATDVYQEGLVIPPSKYDLERDWNGGTFERLVASNIRVPDQTIGDFNAQFAACRVGIARVQELCRRHGAAAVKASMAGMIDYCERRVRAAIAAIPDGVYTGEDAVDDDGIGTTPLPVRATVTISGDTLEVDYAGTSPQVATALNAPFASTVSSTLGCLKGILTGADVPFNEGARRAIRIKAPEGSLLNPRFPAPVRARMEAIYRAYDAVLRAMGQAIPDRVIACGFDSTVATCLSYLHEGRYRVYLEIHNGGYGASSRGDGCDAVAGPLSNCTNVPVESLDMDFDFFEIESYAMRPGTGGAGHHRGGNGSRRVYRILRDGVRFSIYADRFRVAASGLGGGMPGALGGCRVIRDGQQVELKSKDAATLRQGDLLVLETGGGGGWGDPATRDPAGAARDARHRLAAE